MIDYRTKRDQDCDGVAYTGREKIYTLPDGTTSGIPYTDLQHLDTWSRIKQMLTQLTEQFTISDQYTQVGFDLI